MDSVVSRTPNQKSEAMVTIDRSLSKRVLPLIGEEKGTQFIFPYMAQLRKLPKAVTPKLGGKPSKNQVSEKLRRDNVEPTTAPEVDELPNVLTDGEWED